MGIKADIQSLSPSALIELFELDMSNTTSGGKLFFHAGTNELMEPVVWQGVSYEPWPIKASGFDKTGQGTLPRPKIQVSNFAGTVSAEVQANDYLVGCRIIRKMTLARFLDAANFKDGNPTADPNQHFPDEMWFVEQKTLETHEVVEFELSSVFDLMGVQL
ncbi:phage minor tail protein L, partial [Yersinia pestis]